MRLIVGSNWWECLNFILYFCICVICFLGLVGVEFVFINEVIMIWDVYGIIFKWVGDVGEFKMWKV